MTRRILVVDDDRSVREAIQQVLEKAGYQVVLSADGREAEAYYFPGQVDLVLLDLNLPLQSGWEVFERLTRRYPLVPVIVITGMPDQYETARAVGAGALIEKPLDVSDLLNAMEKLLAEPQDTPLKRMCGF